MGELMESDSISNKMQTIREVILFPMPEAGHMNPMFHVAQVLHSKGMSITFILAKYKSPKPSNFPPDYTFHFIDDGLVDTWGGDLNDPVAVLFALMDNCEKPFRPTLTSILAAQKLNKRSVACLITDPFWKFAAPVCEEFNLPRITLFSSTLVDLVILSSPDVHQHEDYSKFPQIIEFVDEIKTSCAVICNSFEELEGQSLEALRQQIPQTQIFPIGPLHKRSITSATSSYIQDKTHIISWLDNQAPKSVLYVSFGSLATITKAEVEEIAWGLADSKQSFIWVIRTGLVQNGSNNIENSQLLSEFGSFLEETRERGLIVAWAPQQEVLAHSAIGGVFVHGGWNSTLESMAEGVPMIVMPCFFPDQKTIAHYVSDVWKIGLHVQRGAERGEVEKAIRTIMMGKDGEEIREKVVTFKDMVSSSLKEGGSSYDSLEKLCSFILQF